MSVQSKLRQVHMIAGFPRAGSTLLCQILNSNPSFHATPTSAIIDSLTQLRSHFSQNGTWRAQDRLKIYDNYKTAMRGFVYGYYYDKEVVFDKNRSWLPYMNIWDTIMGDENSKIIWLYRDPAEIISSIEHHYQKTILLENMDEISAPAAFSTLDRRIGTYANPDGIIQWPVNALRDALEQGIGPRILFVKFWELTNHPKEVLDHIHKFIGEPPFEYDFDNIKQHTWEFDGVYNYKSPHQIKEGKIEFKKGSYELPLKYREAINQRFEPINRFILNQDPSLLLHIPPQEEQQSIQGAQNGGEETPHILPPGTFLSPGINQ